MSLGAKTFSVLPMRELSLKVKKLQDWHSDSDHLNLGLGLHSTNFIDIVGWRRVKLASLFQCLSVWGLVILLL